MTGCGGRAGAGCRLGERHARKRLGAEYPRLLPGGPLLVTGQRPCQERVERWIARSNFLPGLSLNGGYRELAFAAIRLRHDDNNSWSQKMLGTILLIILILILIGSLPTWPYSAGWGYYPTGGIGLLLVIVVILLLVGRI